MEKTIRAGFLVMTLILSMLGGFVSAGEAVDPTAGWDIPDWDGINPIDSVISNQEKTFSFDVKNNQNPDIWRVMISGGGLTITSCPLMPGWSVELSPVIAGQNVCQYRSDFDGIVSGSPPVTFNFVATAPSDLDNVVSFDVRIMREGNDNWGGTIWSPTVLVDGVAPGVTVFPIDANLIWVTTEDFPVFINYNDVGGLATCSYAIYSDGVSVSSNEIDCLGMNNLDLNPENEPALAQIFGAEGLCSVQGQDKCEVRAWATDTAENIGIANPSGVFSIDYENPTITLDLESYPNQEDWQSSDISGTYTVSDENSVSCELHVFDGPEAVEKTILTPCGSSTVTVGSGKNCAFEGEQSCQFFVRVTDAAGNSADSELLKYSVDYQSPSIIVDSYPTGWQTTNFNVGYSITDANLVDCSVVVTDGDKEPVTYPVECGAEKSLLVSVGAEEAKCTEQGSGKCKLQFKAKDATLNEPTTSNLYAFDIDYTKPVATLHTIDIDDSYVSADDLIRDGGIKIGLTCADVGSSIPLELDHSGNANGEGIVIYYSTDGASWDDIADSYVEYNCQENYALIDWSDLGKGLSDGKFYLFALATDNAGNLEEEIGDGIGEQQIEVDTLGLITIDTTGPTVSNEFLFGPSWTNNEDTVVNGDLVSVSTTVTDDLTAVKECTLEVIRYNGEQAITKQETVLSDLGGNIWGNPEVSFAGLEDYPDYTVFVNCLDEAGNVEGTRYLSADYNFAVDKSPPVIVSKGPEGTFYVGDSITFTAKVCDALTYPSVAYWGVAGQDGSNEMQPVNDATLVKGEWCRDFSSTEEINGPMPQIDIKIEVTSADLVGNKAIPVSWWISLRSTYELNLFEGRNMKSLPINPVSAGTATVLGSAKNEIDTVWTYNATQPDVTKRWVGYKYVTNSTGQRIGSCTENCLTEIKGGEGYILEANADATVLIDGSDFGGEIGQIPPTYPIQEGAWNLIGVKSKFGTTANEYLSNLDWKYPTVYYNDGSVRMYCMNDVGGDYALIPGQSYWVYVVGNDNAIVPPITELPCPEYGGPQ